MKKIKNLIALYGITNIGKTTQLQLIVERCKAEEKLVHFQKYPIYNLEPTGPLILEAIKGGNPKGISADGIQALMARNRFDAQDQIDKTLENVSVIAEMYTGTGIAYGIGDEVSKEYLLALNEGLRIPDISILLDGERFMESVEKGHRFEEDNEKTEHIRKIHYNMAVENKWCIVDANQTPDKVHSLIWYLIKDYL